MKRVTVKGFANFVVARPAKQRKIVHDFKFPDPEGRAQAAYYREARKGISTYHTKNYEVDWLITTAEKLDDLADSAPQIAGTRLRHNSRAIRQYAEAFASKRYEVFTSGTFELVHNDVNIAVHPDLFVREGSQLKLIKFDFGVEPPDEMVAKVVGQVMYEAANQSGLTLFPSQVLFVDVARHQVHKGTRVGSRMAIEIRAACENISAIWETI